MVAPRRACWCCAPVPAQRCVGQLRPDRHLLARSGRECEEPPPSHASGQNSRTHPRQKGTGPWLVKNAHHHPKTQRRQLGTDEVRTGTPGTAAAAHVPGAIYGSPRRAPRRNTDRRDQLGRLMLYAAASEPGSLGTRKPTPAHTVHERQVGELADITAATTKRTFGVRTGVSPGQFPRARCDSA